MEVLSAPSEEDATSSNLPPALSSLVSVASATKVDRPDGVAGDKTTPNPVKTQQNSAQTTLFQDCPSETLKNMENTISSPISNEERSHPGGLVEAKDSAAEQLLTGTPHPLSSSSSLMKLLKSRNWSATFPEDAKYHVDTHQNTNNTNMNEERPIDRLYPANVETLIELYENLCRQNSSLTASLRRLYLNVLPLCFRNNTLADNSTRQSELSQAREDAVNCGALQNFQFNNESASKSNTEKNDKSRISQVIASNTNRSNKVESTVSNASVLTKTKVVAGNVIRVSPGQGATTSTDGVVHAAVVKGSVKPLSPAGSSFTAAGVNPKMSAPLTIPSSNDRIVVSSQDLSDLKSIPNVSSSTFHEIAAAFESETVRAMEILLRQKELDSLLVDENLERYNALLSQKEDEVCLWRSAYDHLLKILVTLVRGRRRLLNNEVSDSENRITNEDCEGNIVDSLSKEVSKLLQLIGIKDENARYTVLQLEALQYEYTRMIELKKEDEKELSLLRERTQQLEGQIERISAMNMEHAPAPSSPVAPPIDTSALQNQIKEMQIKLDRRSRQVIEASKQKAALENALSSLQSEKCELQRSLREKTLQLEERELDAARGATGYAVSQSLHQREVELLQLKRAFQERTARYKIETEQWKERERVYMAAHQRLSVQAIELLRRTLLYEEMERQWAEEKQKMVASAVVAETELKRNQEASSTDRHSLRKAPPDSIEEGVSSSALSNRDEGALSPEPRKSEIQSGAGVFEAKINSVQPVGMPSIVRVSEEESQPRTMTITTEELPTRYPADLQKKQAGRSEISTTAMDQMCDQTESQEATLARQLDIAEASHKAEKKRLRTMIHELQQTILLQRKRGGYASVNTNRESSCQSPVCEPVLWHSTNDRFSPDPPPQYGMAAGEDLGSEMASFTLPENACTASAVANLQHECDILSKEKSALQNELSALKVKYQQASGQLKQMEQRSANKPSTLQLSAGSGMSGPPPSLHQTSQHLTSSCDVKGIQMLLQQTLMEKMELEERLAQLERRVE